MPKRVVDGDALWRSRKLLLVPPEYRGEYANLLPLADVNGSFECDPTSIWADVYSYNRANITVANVTAMLDAFEAAGMLVRWKQEGKTWGYFVGIHRPGRLPSGKHLSRHRNLPPLPPSPVNNGFQDAIGDSGTVRDIPGVSLSVPENPPLGKGLGRGLGSTLSGNIPEDGSSQCRAEPYEDFDGSEWALNTFKAYPTSGDMEATVAPARLAETYRQTIEAEAPSRGGLVRTAQWFLGVTREFARQSADREPQFIMGLDKFLRQGYAEVKMPRASGSKYIPKESDEECERRLREEARERRRAANTAKEVAATA
jgi:hypothetical protein